MANICFKGTLGAKLQPGEQLTEDEDGNLESIREYSMDASELSGFLNDNQRGDDHPIYQGLYLTGKSSTISGGECLVSLTYTGREGGDQSDGGETLVSRSIQIRSAEITKDGTAYTVQYISPTATIAYVSKDDLRAPSRLPIAKMGTEAAPNNDTKNGVSIAAAIARNGEDPPADATTFFTLDTHYEIKIAADGFNSNEISGIGTRWSVTETWAAVIVEKLPV